MPFHKLENSTTMDAADVNSNFLYVAQGTRLPYSDSGSMSALDSTHDLGSSATTWNTLYCNNILTTTMVTPDKSTWMKIVDVLVSETTSRIDIENLNSDSNDEFVVYMKTIGFGNYSFLLNKLSTGVEYYQNYGGVGTNPGGGKLSRNSFGTEIGYSNLNNSSFCRLRLRLTTDSFKIHKKDMIESSYANFTTAVRGTIGVMVNTAAGNTITITTFSFFDLNGEPIEPKSHIIIFARQ